ncbi:MAG: hypothetical protein R3E83_22120 [Burkholderiaceae bacterium]
MKRWTAAVLALLMIAVCNPSVAQTAPRGNGVHVQRVALMDNNGFERPMPASYVLIPVGWRSEGGVRWGQQFMCTNGYNFDWRASSPDGAFGFAVLPMARWGANNFGGAAGGDNCPSAPFTDAQQYLTAVVTQVWPGARVLEYRQRLDMIRPLAPLFSRTPMPLGETRTWVDAGEVLFAFDDRGRDMRGTVSAAVLFSFLRTDLGGGSPPMDALTGFSFPVFVATAPNGRLDFGFSEAVRQSFRDNPDWTLRINEHNVKIGKGQLEAARERQRIFRETNDYISALRADTQRMRDESNARNNREFGEYIKGVETYKDPDAPGGQVELSNYYDNAWRLNDGSYALSTDPNFEPWRDLGMEGQRLEAVR